MKPFSSIIDTVINTYATKETRELLGGQYFNYPKSVDLLYQLVNQSTSTNDIILDFFAGSATTANAVFKLNAEDNCNRRFIMVQLPDICDEESEAYKAGYKTIAEISKERIRLAGKKIKEANASKQGIDQLDVGFRVLKIDSSNIKPVHYFPNDISQRDILGQINNIREDRSNEDLLFQILLDWGLYLTLPITEETIVGRKVYFVDTDALAACFNFDVDDDFIKQLAARKPLRVVFRDECFSSDSAKINAEQIFKLISPNTEIKSI